MPRLTKQEWPRLGGDPSVEISMWPHTRLSADRGEVGTADRALVLSDVPVLGQLPCPCDHLWGASPMTGSHGDPSHWEQENARAGAGRPTLPSVHRTRWNASRKTSALERDVLVKTRGSEKSHVLAQFENKNKIISWHAHCHLRVSPSLLQSEDV